MSGASVLRPWQSNGPPRISLDYGLSRPTSRPVDLCAPPGADRACDSAHEIARERIWHDGACDRHRRPCRLVRRRDDQRRQPRACADFWHSLRCSPKRRLAGRAPRRLWCADAGRTVARRDRPLAVSQKGASRSRSGRGQRLARRAHVAPPKPFGGDADRDLEWLRRIGRARGGLCADRRGRRLVSRREIALAPTGSPRARRLRGGRRDCGGVRRAAHWRLLRLRAHHRRLFARERDSRLRRHPRRVAHHSGDHWRALRHHSAHRRPADVRRLWRADWARPGRGGGGRRRNAGGGVDRTGVPLGDPVASRSTGRWRIDGRFDGALQPAGAGRRPRRARARLLLADDGDGVGDAHRAQAVRLPRFARVGLSRRNVLRLAVRRLAARQALFDRRRRRRAVDGTRDHGLRAGRHGRA